MEFFKKTNIGYIVLWVLTPLPGTELYSEMMHDGRIFETDWSKYDLNHVVYTPINFTPKELYDQFWKCYLEFYSANNIFTRAIHYLNSPDKPPNKFHMELLIQFYMRKQLKAHNHPYSMGIDRI